MAPLNSLNGQPTQQPTSGLRNIKRDWSDLPSQPTTSQSSEAIDWPPSPERPLRHKPSKGYESGRLARIQAVLAANNQSSHAVLTPSSSLPKKRPSDPESHSTGPATKKRVLPTGWDRESSIKQEPQAPTVASSSFGSASIAPVPQAPESDTTANVARIFLSNEQQQILKLVEAGNNVFFTGSAGVCTLCRRICPYYSLRHTCSGTGKSVLLREIIKSLRKKFRKVDDAVAITASTGIAACNVGGVTLHSFGGIGLGIESAEHLANKIRGNAKARTRWLRTQVLIIDEGGSFLSLQGGILTEDPCSVHGGRRPV